MTRDYLKLSESSNLLEDNPIDRRNWKKLTGGTLKVPCSKMRIEETRRRRMYNKRKFLREVKLRRVKVR